tara:strand:- start:360 stop:596 length:237 start_codon:yes stop_codon:yes gene_type:complete
MTEYPSSTSSSDILFDQWVENMINSAEPDDVTEVETEDGKIEYRLMLSNGHDIVITQQEYYRIIWGMEDVNETYKPEF